MYGYMYVYTYVYIYTQLFFKCYGKVELRNGMFCIEKAK